MGDVKLDSNYFICRSEDLAGTRKGELCQEYLDTFCSGPPSYHRNEKGESVSGYAFNSFDRSYYSPDREGCFQMARSFAASGEIVLQSPVNTLNPD